MSEVKETKFEILEFSGEAHERGFQYGSTCKKNLSQLVPIWYSIYQSFDISKEQIIRDARKFFPFIEDYSPEIADEMKGTAEGAGVLLEEIVMITAFCEMFYPRAFSSSCTSFAVTKNASADKRSYIGQTNDEAESLWMGGGSHVVVLFRRPSGPSVLTYTYAGVPVDIGINSDGLGFCSTAVTCEDVRLGVPRIILSREVLHQRTITDAIGAVTRAKRANSLHFLIAGRSGEVCDIEGTPTQLDYFYFKDTFAHTNHFLSSRLAMKRDLGLETQPDTITRYIRMRELLETAQGPIDLQNLMEFTKDHVNYPDSICRHGDTRDPADKRWRTFGSLIMVPEEKEMWIARGNPCESRYERYSIA